MPKLKTNKAMKKRFKVTKTGKVLAPTSFHRHLMTDRSSKKKRKSRKWQAIDSPDVRHIKRGLPYG
jgi:large subunit ribosomal protein L35